MGLGVCVSKTYKLVKFIGLTHRFFNWQFLAFRLLKITLDSLRGLASLPLTGCEVTMNPVNSNSIVGSEQKSVDVESKVLIYFSGIRQVVFAASLTLALIIPTRAVADNFFFSTGNVTNQIATASRPSSPGKIEIESADDFVLNTSTKINQATFTGLVPTGSTVNEVVIEIYRVFPADSNVGR